MDATEQMELCLGELSVTPSSMTIEELKAAGSLVAAKTLIGHEAMDGDVLFGRSRSIQAGEGLAVLRIRDFRAHSTPEQLRVFGEFKALVSTDDGRMAWAMPYQIHAKVR